MPQVVDADSFNRAKQLWGVLQDIFLANKSAPIIVEGKKDKEALRRLGFTEQIIVLHSGKGYYDFCEELKDNYNTVILLIDWDHKGNEIYKKLSENLMPLSAEYAFLRQRLIYLCQKDIVEVQSIPTLINRLIGQDIKVGDNFDDFEDVLRSNA